MERETFICSCHSNEHQVIFTRFEEEHDGLKYDEISIDIHLYNHDNFFKRLWTGLKYAFGYKSKYGHWDNIMLEPKQVEKLGKFIGSNYNLDFDKIIECIDRHGNDKGTKLDKVTLITCRNIVKGVKNGII